MSTHTQLPFRNTTVSDGFVLILECDKVFGAMLAERISSLTPYRPLLTPNPSQALYLAQVRKPCLFLLASYLGPDYHRLGSSGIDLYDRLRLSKAQADLPVIMIVDVASEAAVAEKRGITCFRKDKHDFYELIEMVREKLALAHTTLEEAVVA